MATEESTGIEFNTDLVLGVIIIAVGLLLAGLVAYQNGQLEWVKRMLPKNGNN